MAEYQLLLVEWVDSYGCSPVWEPIAEIKPEICHARSVGWLVAENNECITIVPHVSETAVRPQGCGDMTIPRRSIVKITKLVEADHGSE